VAQEDENAPSLKQPDVLFASFFGVGFAKWAPGTWGTLATMPILWLLGRLNPPALFFIPFLTVFFLISSFIVNSLQERLKLHDPGWIVIDEVIGVSVAWLFLSSHGIGAYIALFVLFRFFDIIKIWPASYFDRQVKHGYGTIADDVISGIFAGVVLMVAQRTISFLA
jgi:phosphatidylglycerophosphatase A